MKTDKTNLVIHTTGTIIPGNNCYIVKYTLRAGTKEIQRYHPIQRQAREELETILQNLDEFVISANFEKIIGAINDDEYQPYINDLFHILLPNISERKKWDLEEKSIEQERWDSYWKSIMDKRLMTILNDKDTMKHLQNMAIESFHGNRTPGAKAVRNLMEAFLDTAQSFGIVPKNVLKAEQRRLRETAEGKAISASSAVTLADDQMCSYLERLLKLHDESLRLNMLLQTFLLLKPEEACGLNRGDIIPVFSKLTVLRISRQYKADKNGNLQICPVDTLNAERDLPIPTFLEAEFIRVCQKIPKNPNTPLFVDDNGQRLNPNMVKKLEKDLIKEVFNESFRETNNKGILGRKRIFDPAKQLILRSNGKEHLKRVGLAEADINYILGIDRGHTYAVWYAAYRSPLVQIKLKAYFDKWFSRYTNQPSPVVIKKTIKLKPGESVEIRCNEINIMAKEK